MLKEDGMARFKGIPAGFGARSSEAAAHGHAGPDPEFPGRSGVPGRAGDGCPRATPAGSKRTNRTIVIAAAGKHDRPKADFS
jgi:hypothetical protein